MSRRTVLLMLVLAALGLGAYACWPRKADLRSFDPAAMARLETAMWRDYYDRHYPIGTGRGRRWLNGIGWRSRASCSELTDSAGQPIAGG